MVGRFLTSEVRSVMPACMICGMFCITAFTIPDMIWQCVHYGKYYSQEKPVSRKQAALFHLNLRDRTECSVYDAVYYLWKSDYNCLDYYWHATSDKVISPFQFENCTDQKSLGR